MLPQPVESSPILARPISADRHPMAVYLGRLAPGTRRSAAQSLEVIASILSQGRAPASAIDYAALRYQHTHVVRAILAETYKPGTANKHLCALRGVLKEAWRLGLLPDEDYHRAADVPAIKGSTILRGRALSWAELRALFEACGDGPVGARDRALLAVLARGGLRRSEVVALDVADFDPDEGTITVRQGKGSKDRVVYLPDAVVDAVASWLSLRGVVPGPLFLPVDKGGSIGGDRLTDQAVYNRLRALAHRAGVKSFSPHDLRRTYISDAIDSSGDLVAIRDQVGHASISTTANYDRRKDRAKKAVAATLRLP